MTKQFILSLTILFGLIACNNSDNSKTIKLTTDITKTTTQSDTLPSFTYKNIKSVFEDKDSHPWVNINYQDTSPSLSLHFNLDMTDTLAAAYSPECWIFLPYKVSSDKITVYWDKIIDSKYNFDLVKAINKIDKKYIGKPFMELKLINDTTLQATYNFPDLIKKLNSSNKKRVFFPDKYIVSREYVP